MNISFMPISIKGDELLDKHNDSLASFDKLTELEIRESIVRAVNCHEELLAAVKGMKMGIKGNADYDQRFIEVLDKLIAKAEGK